MWLIQGGGVSHRDVAYRLHHVYHCNRNFFLLGLVTVALRITRPSCLTFRPASYVKADLRTTELHQSLLFLSEISTRNHSFFRRLEAAGIPRAGRMAGRGSRTGPGAGQLLTAAALTAGRPGHSRPAPPRHAGKDRPRLAEILTDSYAANSCPQPTSQTVQTCSFRSEVQP